MDAVGSNKFLYPDVIAVRQGAVDQYIKIPTRCRLPGMVVDLSDDDKRTIAFFISVLTHLNRTGVTDPVSIEGLFPNLFTAEQQVVEGM